MKVGIVGCGYVFDHYMATWGRHKNLELVGVADVDKVRLERVVQFYALKSYATTEAMLADPDIEIIVNLTSIESHFEVTKAALLAGKHVYSEKPLVTELSQARELLDLAESLGLRLSCAPSNALGDTSQTMWKAVLDGAVGDVRLVYAEFDDNVIYRMHPEQWRSRTGAAWPFEHEYEQGCTFEHVGYHLTWMCAMFGPVARLTAFSKHVLVDKTEQLLTPSDTPDFSVAILEFASGVTARVTCSIGVPYDHRMRIFGNRGILSADTYRHYRSPVYLERFNQLALNARKSVSVRTNTFLQWMFGVGGQRLRLLSNILPGGGRAPALKWWSPKSLLAAFKRGELGQQDKALGIAELADALLKDRQPFPPHDFTLHLTELTILIQSAGSRGITTELETSFLPVLPRAETLNAKRSYLKSNSAGWIYRRIDEFLVGMHKPKTV